MRRDRALRWQRLNAIDRRRGLNVQRLLTLKRSGIVLEPSCLRLPTRLVGIPEVEFPKGGLSSGWDYHHVAF